LRILSAADVTLPCAQFRLLLAEIRRKKSGHLLVRVRDVFLYDGGPFGLEEQVTTSGPGMTLLYHLLIPLFWCIPISLVAAELTTAMPVQGGFYRWVRAGYGDFGDSSRAGGIGPRRFARQRLCGSLHRLHYGVLSEHRGVEALHHFGALIAVIAYVNVRGLIWSAKFPRYLKSAY